MTTGENTGTWGNVTNVNLGTALEEAIVGTGTVTFAGATIVIAGAEIYPVPAFVTFAY